METAVDDVNDRIVEESDSDEDSNDDDNFEDHFEYEEVEYDGSEESEEEFI